MASIVVTRVDGHGKVTGDASLMMERIGDVVLIKLGMIRVRVPIAQWVELDRQVAGDLAGHDGQAAALARAVLQIADAGDMPDTYWQTDSRIKLARSVLGVPEDGRHTHDHLWDAD